MTPSAQEVLSQLFVKGPTWDGNLVSKDGRDELRKMGCVERMQGWNWLTRRGMRQAIAIGQGSTDRQWQAKAGCR